MQGVTGMDSVFRKVKQTTNKQNTLRQGERPTYEMLLDENCDGLTVLFERYSRKLFGYGTHTWKMNEDDNWDLIYKTLYKVYEKREVYTFDNEKGFQAIVFKIYINYLRKHYRKQQQLDEQATFSTFNESLFEETGGQNRSLGTERDIQQKLVEDDLESKKDPKPDSPKMRMLKEELAKLEDWQRILLLLKSQNMPYAEIARYVDKPANQLKVYYSRLKKRVEKRMHERLKGA